MSDDEERPGWTEVAIPVETRRTARQAEELPLAHAQVGAAVGELVLQPALERRDEWAQLRKGRGAGPLRGWWRAEQDKDERRGEWVACTRSSASHSSASVCAPSGERLSATLPAKRKGACRMSARR